MVIRKKDGSIYKPSGPNKLLINQDFWFVNEKVKLINFDKYFNREAIENKYTEDDYDLSQFEENCLINFENNKAMNIVREEPETTTFKEDDMPIITQETTKSLEKDIQDELQNIQFDSSDKSVFRKLEKLTWYCLPYDGVRYYDDLYDEWIDKGHYGTAFKFQCSLIKLNDLECLIWTTINKIVKNSVLYDSSNKRWWLVDSIADDTKKDGFIFKLVPSSFQPDFT